MGRALPPHYYDQAAGTALIKERWASRHFNLDRVDELHKTLRVKGRYLCLPPDEIRALNTFGEANAAFVRIGREISERAVRDALSRARLDDLAELISARTGGES